MLEPKGSKWHLYKYGAIEKRAAADATKSTVKKINASVEKTTLGDIAGLAALKSAMEAAEAKNAKKAAAKEETEE